MKTGKRNSRSALNEDRRLTEEVIALLLDINEAKLQLGQMAQGSPDAERQVDIINIALVKLRAIYGDLWQELTEGLEE